MVGAENEEDCKRWIEALTASGKVYGFDPLYACMPSSVA